MKRILISFTCGALIGASVVIAFLVISPRTESSQSAATLDWLINQWTSTDVLLAGTKWAVELPDARPGFFPDTVRSLAQTLDAADHIPKGVTLAQWALESKWGERNLGASNYFGHTYEAVAQYMPHPEFIWAREYVMIGGRITIGDSVRFARYRNIRDCFETHGRYLSLSPRFAYALRTSSPEKFARALSSYAVDPDYSIKLITIMRRYSL